MTAIVKDGYSPPEQYSRDPTAQGAWSDIYAIGAILYFAITGEKPLPAPDRQLGKALRPISGQAAYDAYRPQFLAGIERALTLQPRERPATVRELRTYLRPPDAVSTPPSRLPADAEPGEVSSRPAASPSASGLSSAAGSVSKPKVLSESQLWGKPAKVEEKAGVPWLPLVAGLGLLIAGAAILVTTLLARDGENGERQQTALLDEQGRKQSEQQRQEAERQRQVETERQRQADAERQRQADAERQRQADAERQRQADAERQRQADAERQRQADAERQRQADAERQRQADAERQRQQLEAVTTEHDGVYSSEVSAGCGEAPQRGVLVRVANGRLTFVHRLQGIEYQWSGRVSMQGDVRATVAGSDAYAASGKFTDYLIELRYPQCSVLNLRIRNRTR
jgi:hypothetical protein